MGLSISILGMYSHTIIQCSSQVRHTSRSVFNKPPYLYVIPTSNSIHRRWPSVLLARKRNQFLSSGSYRLVFWCQDGRSGQNFHLYPISSAEGPDLSRLWVVQEYTLSRRDPTAHWGDAKTTMSLVMKGLVELQGNNVPDLKPLNNFLRLGISRTPTH